MAGYLPSESKAYLLSLLATQGRYVGLAVDIDSTLGPNIILANITEPATPGYGRAGVTWGAPVTDLSGTVSISNSADVNFPVVTADLDPCTYAFVTDAASGTNGRVYYVWTLTEPVTTLAGKPTKAPAGGLIIE